MKKSFSSLSATLLITAGLLSLGGCAAARMTARMPLVALTLKDAPPPELVANALAVGADAPAMELQSALGNPWTLSQKVSSGPVVMVFFRGSWCPYCRAQLTDLQAALPAFKQAGATVVAISPDDPAAAKVLTEALGLQFDVLADPTRAGIKSFGVLDGRLDSSWPATFIVAPNGKVVWRSLADSFKKRPPAQAVTEALAALSLTPEGTKTAAVAQ